MKNIYSRILLILFCSVIFNIFNAQDKYIKDPNFNAAFQSNTHFVDGKEIITTVSQPDGKLLIVYKTYEHNLLAEDISKIVRINADYTLDTTYNGNDFDGPITSIALQSDGKILAAGSFTKYNNTAAKNIIRLNTNGTRDNTFAVGSGFGYYNYDSDKSIRKVAVVNGDKILVAGNFWTYNGISKKYMIKLNGDGSIDNAFNFDAGYDLGVKGFDLQQNGKIVVAYSSRVMRFNIDGSIDSDFNILDGGGNGVSGGDIKCIAVRNDDKIYLGGKFVISLNRQYVARLNADGTVDPGFFPKKFYTTTPEDSNYNGVFSLLPQADGKVIIGGSFRKFGDDWVGGIIRLKNDGTLDSSFSGRISSMRYGNPFSEVVQHLSFYNDGSIIAGGRILLYNEVAANNIVRFSATDGQVNMSFRNICKGFDRAPHKIFVQQDGKMIVTGAFSSYNGITRDRIIRLNTDGTVDESFRVDTHIYLSTGNYPNDIQFQQDGKILMATEGFMHTSFFGAFGASLVRLNQDGSLDTSFFSLVGNDIGLEGVMRKFIIRNDGKIVVPNMNRHNSVTLLNREITTLDTDGNIDTSITYQKPYSSILSLKLLPDNKILLSGNNSGSVSGKILGRILPNGQIDPSFTMTPSLNNNIEFYPTPEGKILGLEINATIHRISRFNNDGTVDDTFTPPIYPATGSPLSFQPLEFENNGKFFTTVPSGFNSKSLVRHNANGSYDTTFDIGTGFTISHTKYYGDIVADVKKQGNGFLVAGEFDYFDGQYTKGITRLIPQNSLNVNDEKAFKKTLIYPNPTTGILNITTKEFTQYEIYDTAGRTVIKSSELKPAIDVSHLSAGSYFLKLKGIKEISVQKFIKK